MWSWTGSVPYSFSGFGQYVASDLGPFDVVGTKGIPDMAGFCQVQRKNPGPLPVGKYVIATDASATDDQFKLTCVIPGIQTLSAASEGTLEVTLSTGSELGGTFTSSAMTGGATPETAMVSAVFYVPCGGPCP